MDRIINFFKNINNNDDEAIIIKNGFDNYKNFYEQEIINNELKRLEKIKRDIEIEQQEELNLIIKQKKKKMI